MPSPASARFAAGARHAWRFGVRRCLLALLATVWVGILLLGAQRSTAFDSARVMATAQRMGSGTAARAQALVKAIQEASRMGEVARLGHINAHLNQNIQYRDDQEIWGVLDYWATPLEMLSKGQGDCEDYAIGKYFSLIAAGVPSVKMRLVYVRAQLDGSIQPHMVLAYYPSPNAEPLILDNLIDEIRSASQRPDLAPVFSFNAEGLWQGVTGASAGDPTARLSKWRDVFNKVRAEGWW